MSPPGEKYKIVNDAEAYDGRMEVRGSFPVILKRGTILFFDEKPEGQANAGRSRSGNVYSVDASDLAPARPEDDHM